MRRLIAVAIVLIAALSIEAAEGRTARVLDYRQLDALNGWTLLEAGLFRTADGGTSWQRITPGGVPGSAIGGVAFRDANRGWIAITVPSLGSDAYAISIAATTDGGLTWRGAKLPMAEDDASDYAGHASIFFADEHRGWTLVQLVSSANGSRARLFATSDGGATWTALPRPPIAGTVRFADERHGWIHGGPGRSELHATSDGGRTWREQRIASPVEGQRVEIVRMETADARTATVIANLAGSTDELRYVTTDSGETWALANDAALKATASGAWQLERSGVCRGFKSDCVQESRLVQGGLDITPGGPYPPLPLEREPASVRTILRPEALGTNGTVGIESHDGFDRCDAPKIAAMSAWWTGSPYYAAAVYIGGSYASCKVQTYLKDGGWTAAAVAQGWDIVPIWVGPQAQGWDAGTGTIGVGGNAYSQGQAEATSAASAARGFGMERTIIYYNLEPYTAPSQTARTNAMNFVRGWVDTLHSLGYRAGLYIHIRNAVDDLAPMCSDPSRPDDVWIVKAFITKPANNSVSVYGLTYLSTTFSDSCWNNHQRIRQYYLDNSSSTADNESYGGYTFDIDNDRLDGHTVSAAGNELSVNDRVSAIAGFRIRSTAAGTLGNTLTGGQQGTVLTGPVSASIGDVVYHWFDVRWDDNQRGWTAGEGLVGIGAAQNPTGTLTVSATLNNQAWTGSVSYQLTGASTQNGSSVPQTFNSAPTGSYTLQAPTSGGPSGATFAGIDPAATQQLSTGGTTSWTIRWTSCTAPSKPQQSGTGSVQSGQAYTISWSSTSPLNNYEIQESTSSSFNSGTQTFTVNGTSRNFSHTVQSTTTYYYRVRANSNCGWSQYATTHGVSVNANCTYSTPATPSSFGSGGGGGTFALSAPSGCAWTATSDATDWLTTSSSGSGNGFVSYSVAPNNTTQQRVGTITVQTVQFTIVQTGKNPPAAVPSVRSDFNFDSRPDHALFNSQTGILGIWLLDGVNLAGTGVAGQGVSGFRFAGIGDTDGDGRSDILLQNNANGDVGVWKMNGTSLASGAVVGTPGTGWRAITTADLNGDNRQDVITQNTSNGDVGGWLMNGFTQTAAGVLGRPGVNWQVVASGDFNADGKADLVVRDSTTGVVGVWLMNGLTQTAGVVVATPGTSWEVVAAADLDASGGADLVIRNNLTGNISAWLLNGTTISGSGLIGTPGLGWTVAGTADFDRDGRADLIVRETATGNLGWWKMNGTTLVSGAIYGVPGAAWEVVRNR